MARRSVRGAIAGRGFILFPASAFAVHQLRYTIGYGSRAGQALAAQGHGYLDSLAPWVALLVALGFWRFLTRIARSLAGREELRPRRSFAALWFVAWAALVATYVIQEWLEGLFSAGHPGGLEGIFGHGGYSAVPLAALAALLVTCVLRIGSAVLAAVRRTVGETVARLESAALRRPLALAQLRRAPLTDRAAGRAPPWTRRSALAL